MQGWETTSGSLCKSLLEEFISFNVKAEWKWLSSDTSKGPSLPPDLIKLEVSLRYWLSKHTGEQFYSTPNLSTVFSSFAHFCKSPNHPVLSEFTQAILHLDTASKKSQLWDSKIHLPKSVLNQRKQRTDRKQWSMVPQHICKSRFFMWKVILFLTLSKLCLPALPNCENTASQFENFTMYGF